MRRQTKLTYPNHPLPPWLFFVWPGCSHIPVFARHRRVRGVTLTLLSGFRPLPLPGAILNRDRSNRLLDDATTGGVCDDVHQSQSTYLCRAHPRRNQGTVNNIAKATSRHIGHAIIKGPCQKPQPGTSPETSRSPQTANNMGMLRRIEPITWSATFIASSNDEVERRGIASSPNEAALSQSSIPSLAHRRRHPRSLEP